MKDLNNFVTTKEISQQPQLWMKTLKIVEESKERIAGFISKAAGQTGLKVILSGAGSSAFVGQSVAPYLNKVTNLSVNAYATTDIVSNPTNYLSAKVPTLLVSFARSGNSPESVATIELAKQLVPNLYQIVLTCDPEGSLAKEASKDDNALVLFMPEEANDKGFAMTGSFSTMALASILIFNLPDLDVLRRDVQLVCTLGERMLTEKLALIRKLAREDFERIVYLGSSTLSGLAREAALKVLELTAGAVVPIFDSFLGFRHGPKSIINRKTLVVAFLSQDSYTRRYEMDLIQEMAAEKKAMLTAVCPAFIPELHELIKEPVYLSEEPIAFSDDIFLLFPYLLFAQLLALIKSVGLGINPDDPSPDGTVNRVVKGVKIYSFS